MPGKVQTVLGAIEPESLGITLMHEHLVLDYDGHFQMPDEASERAWVDAPITMDRLGGLSRKANLANQRLLDVDAAIEEVSQYKYAGACPWWMLRASESLVTLWPWHVSPVPPA